MYWRRFLPKNLGKKLPRKIKIVEVPVKEAKKLNFIYRERNKPANVLSFFYNSDYGEILVCPAIVRQEAQKQGHSFKYQMTWMILHGMIHLAGFHHEKSGKAAALVFQIEQKMLKKLSRI